MNAREQINVLASERVPFLVVISYDLGSIHVIAQEELAEDDIYFSSPIWTYDPLGFSDREVTLRIEEEDRKDYEENLEKLLEDIRNGESYLSNFTTATPVHCPLDLIEIYRASRALFRLYFRGIFVSFSPERFIRIADGYISTHPMKGTILADTEEQARSILQDPKESYEHNTIIDLMRNDLSIHATKVRLEKYRYLSEIRSRDKRLFQVSSSISGRLEEDWRGRLGDILLDMLPAGSISGAPKKRTVELIAKYEKYPRQYYTGIAGFYDGEKFDSAVLIRYLEPYPTAPHYRYRSGGGITALSDPDKEYLECIAKIYVPTY